MRTIAGEPPPPPPASSPKDHERGAANTIKKLLECALAKSTEKIAIVGNCWRQRKELLTRWSCGPLSRMGGSLERRGLLAHRLHRRPSSSAAPRSDSLRLFVSASQFLRGLAGQAPYSPLADLCLRSDSSSIIIRKINSSFPPVRCILRRLETRGGRGGLDDLEFVDGTREERVCFHEHCRFCTTHLHVIVPSPDV